MHAKEKKEVFPCEPNDVRLHRRKRFGVRSALVVKYEHIVICLIKLTSNEVCCVYANITRQFGCRGITLVGQSNCPHRNIYRPLGQKAK